MIKSIEQLNQEFFAGKAYGRGAAQPFFESAAVGKSTAPGPKAAAERPAATAPEAGSEAAVGKPPAIAPEAAVARTAALDQKTDGERPAHGQPLWKDLLSLLAKIALIMLAFVLMFTFLFGLVRYPEPSMAPAIKDGDLIIYHRYTKIGYLPQDVVVLEHNGVKQARRVVAKAGDTVDITERGLAVNGALQQEPDIRQSTERYESGVEFPLTVPEGQVFVLGDRRTGAADSRVYGCVEIEDTFGKVIMVIRRRSI